jgi:putative membrane protein
VSQNSEPKNSKPHTGRKGPVVIELEAPAASTPSSAPAVPDGAPRGRAMQGVATLAGAKSLGPWRFFLTSALSLVGFLASVAAWNFVAGLMARNSVLGWAAALLFAAFVIGALWVALREWAAFARLARIDAIRTEAAAASDLAAARKVTGRLVTLYAGRADTSWGRGRFADRQGDVMDTDTLLELAEAELLTPLDQAARREVERAARQVATVTAVVPLALADVAVALVANIRMIRTIAEIYGGRSGALGSWRLLRAVMGHLVATGAVAVGDDLIHSVAGGGLLSKLSRRFGEGVINGALTARVGVAAMDVCRPLPFVVAPRPKVGNLVSRGLAGLFGAEKAAKPAPEDENS